MLQQKKQAMFYIGELIIDVVTNEEYRVMARLGAGASGNVYRVREEKTGETLVMKFFPDVKGISGEENAKKEYTIARWLENIDNEDQSLVKLAEYAVLPTKMISAKTKIGVTVYTGLVFTDNGGIDLRKYQKTILAPLLLRTESGQADNTIVAKFVNVQILKIASLLTRIVSIFHSHGVIHGDIKPHNIIVTLDSENSVEKMYFIDFGRTCAPQVHEILERFSIKHERDCYSQLSELGERLYAYIGTFAYTDPRALQNGSPAFFREADHLEVFKKFDLYSVGVTIWSLWFVDIDVDKEEFPTASLRMPKYRNHSPLIPPLTLPDQATLEEAGLLAYLFSKMDGKLSLRLHAEVLAPMFADLYKIAREELEAIPTPSRSITNSKSDYESLKDSSAVVGDGIEIKFVSGTNEYGLFADREFEVDEVITLFYGLKIHHNRAIRSKSKKLCILYPGEQWLDGERLQDGTRITNPNVQLVGKGGGSMCRDLENKNNAIMMVCHSDEIAQRLIAHDFGTWMYDPTESEVFLIATRAIRAGEEICTTPITLQ